MTGYLSLLIVPRLDCGSELELPYIVHIQERVKLRIVRQVEESLLIIFFLHYSSTELA